MLPDKINNFLNKGDTTMIAVFFSEGTSANITLEAIDTMRKITSKQCFISGMSAITTDMKHITESEMLIYGLIAVVLTFKVLGWITRVWLKVFAFGVIAVIALIAFGAMLL